MQQHIADAEETFDELDADANGMLDIKELARRAWTSSAARTIAPSNRRARLPLALALRPCSRRSSGSAGRRRTSSSTVRAAPGRLSALSVFL